MSKKPKTPKPPRRKDPNADRIVKRARAATKTIQPENWISPKGRPVDMPMDQYIKSILHIVGTNGKTLGDSILLAQVARASLGDGKAAEFLFDRAYGKPTQNLAISTPPKFEVSYSVVTQEEAQAQVAIGLEAEISDKPGDV